MPSQLWWFDQRPGTERKETRFLAWVTSPVGLQREHGLHTIVPPKIFTQATRERRLWDLLAVLSTLVHLYLRQGIFSGALENFRSSLKRSVSLQRFSLDGKRRWGSVSDEYLPKVSPQLSPSNHKRSQPLLSGILDYGMTSALRHLKLPRMEKMISPDLRHWRVSYLLAHPTP